VEIHLPDGKPDILQQVEHGVLTILGGYENLGRLYRGIIENDLRQYVLLGDASANSDELRYNPKLSKNERTATESGVHDDRWVFTEENAGHEYEAIKGLAAAARVLKGYNDDLAARCLKAATELYAIPRQSGRNQSAKIAAATELLLTTNEAKYKQDIVGMKDQVVRSIGQTGASVACVFNLIDDATFKAEVAEAFKKYATQLAGRQKENPFGVPYNIAIWGDGWGIQRLGMQQYFLHTRLPQIFDTSLMYNALNFMLGNHPGENTSSFASGVGSRSVTVAYGVNRADWSYIPGGVVSGTGIIRPDFPELKEWPYFWQQTEYVMGGGAEHFMFLVLAANSLLQK
jgi:hypothetical protein